MACLPSAIFLSLLAFPVIPSPTVRASSPRPAVRQNAPAPFSIDDLPLDLRIRIPKRIDEYSAAQITRKPGASMLVFAYSYRDKASEPHSQIMIFTSNPKSKNYVPRWVSKTESFYEPRVAIRDEYAYAGKPLIFVTRLAGAAAAELRVFGLAGNTPRTVYSSWTRRFEIGEIDGRKGLVIEHDLGHILEIPRIMAWNGKTFTDVSRQFPGYYKTILDDFLKEVGATVPEQSRADVAVLKTLGGNRSEGVSELKALLDEETRKGKNADRSLIRMLRERLASLTVHPPGKAR